MSRELEALKLWRQQEEINKNKEKIECDVQLSILVGDRILRQKGEKIQRKLLKGKNKNSGSYRISKSKDHQENRASLKLSKFYQPLPPRKRRKETRDIESKVDFPHFHEKGDVEVYLDWKMKVEQLFSCHQVSQDRNVLLANLSFQENIMYQWTSTKKERRLHNELPILYWNDLRSALSCRHIPSY